MSPRGWPGLPNWPAPASSRARPAAGGGEGPGKLPTRGPGLQDATVEKGNEPPGRALRAGRAGARAGRERSHGLGGHPPCPGALPVLRDPQPLSLTSIHSFIHSLSASTDRLLGAQSWAWLSPPVKALGWGTPEASEELRDPGHHSPPGWGRARGGRVHGDRLSTRGALRRARPTVPQLRPSAPTLLGMGKLRPRPTGPLPACTLYPALPPPGSRWP